MKKIRPYTTIAKAGKSKSHSYHDRDSLPFNVKYPLVEFRSEKITVGDNRHTLHKELLGNYWFQKSNVLEREAMLERLVHINKHLDIVLDFIHERYLPLGFTIEHLSIAGSYLHALQPGDIDFDLILSGSYFDYVTFNEGIELLDTTGSVQKISLTVMGIDLQNIHMQWS